MGLHKRKEKKKKITDQEDINTRDAFLLHNYPQESKGKCYGGP